MLRFIKLLAILVLVISSEASPRRHSSNTSRKQLSQELAEPNYRLFPNVATSNYKIDLKLDKDFAETKVFTGTVVIQFAITAIGQGAKSFQIHMKNIDVDGDVDLRDAKNAKIPVTATGPDAITDFVAISSDQALQLGSYILTISYTGYLSTVDMEGFYLSSYKDNQEKDVYLATTQFEEVGARRAFPCFDEPELKATFDISITYPDGYNALSNTKGSAPVAVGDLKKVTFQQTPKMSTYLVAFIVSDFTCTDGDTVDAIPTQVCSRKGTEDTRDTALSTGSDALQAMHDYTGIPFSKAIGKLTQAAIPDFAAGAMENWGMVTFREADLLWVSGRSTNANKQSIVNLITHELSHQWFGDMVTLAWWSDIFLNEGFATYFEYYATDIINPDWELPQQFVVEQLQPALLTDSMASSLPLHYEGSDDPASISSRFDDISYNKGGSVLRMVHYLLGLDIFKAGLNNYVSNNVIATPEILWSSFQTIPEDLPDKLEVIMDSWINKPGYPLVTVTSKGDDVTIAQEAFVLSGDARDTEWYVPISYTLSSKTSDFTQTATKAWLEPKKTLALEGVLKDQKWIILNNQQAGYYRVNYDDNLWSNISTALNADEFSNIDEISRSQIVDNLLNLARAGIKEYSDVFELLGFLKKDDSYYSWHSAFTGFNYLLQRTVDAYLRKQLTNYITELMQGLYEATPIETRAFPLPQVFALKQVLSSTWACDLGMKECVEPMRKMFVDYSNDPTTALYVNYRSIAFCNGLRNSEDAPKDYAFLWSQYLESDLANEKVTILKALGCSNNAAMRKLYLATALSNDVRIPDVTYVFSSVYSNSPEGVDDVLDFIQARHKDFKPRFGDNSVLKNLLSTIGDLLNTQAHIDKLQKFINTAVLDDDVTSAATEAVAAAKANLEVTQSLEAQLKGYFGSPPTTISTTSSPKTTPNSASMNSYHVRNVAFVLVGYILYNFY